MYIVQLLERSALVIIFRYVYNIVEYIHRKYNYHRVEWCKFVIIVVWKSQIFLKILHFHKRPYSFCNEKIC